MITEATFSEAYRNGLTLEEVSLLQSIQHDSRDAALQELQNQLPYVDQELKECCESLYKKLKAMNYHWLKPMVSKVSPRYCYL